MARNGATNPMPARASLRFRSEVVRMADAPVVVVVVLMMLSLRSWCRWLPVSAGGLCSIAYSATGRLASFRELTEVF